MTQVSQTHLLYNLYNGLFLGLPFKDIEEMGSYLTLFNRWCANGIQQGKTPSQIVEGFWETHYDGRSEAEHFHQLRYFIRYIERQVVLFDSVEDALFEQTHDLNGQSSLKNLLHRVKAEQLDEKLLEKIKDYSIRLVLTAHPTQFYPGKVLGIINDLGLAIQANDVESIRLLLLQLGKTTFFNTQKPTPADEAASLAWYLENVFYQTMPDILFRLLQSLGQEVSTFSNPHLLLLGFWPGGDRDGNPHVKPDTTRDVARRLRETILRCYHREIRQIRRRLTFKNVETWMLKAERTINNTLYHPDKEQYTTCQSLIQDLLQAREHLVQEHEGLFLADLDKFILRVRVFGFYFASMDIRQDSRKHAQVWDAILTDWAEKFPFFNLEEFNKADESIKIDHLLSTKYRLDENNFRDEFVKETIATFGVIQEIQAQNGELGCHRYIISNCGSALDVASVLALAKMTFTPAHKTPEKEQQSVPLDIVPLFETIEDLAKCGEVMQCLYTNVHYARHLAARQNVQTIMLGFSDGTKDGGYLRSNWSIYRAKEELTRISREHGVSVIFFDGRGGPPGRGGGNNASYYEAHGTEIESKAIQVTIQGQTVSSTYGTRLAAQYNIERLLTAGLENPLFQTHSQELGESERQLMDELANAAYKAYLELKNHPDFVPYLERVTPLKWYGDTNIASRPTKRTNGGGMRFEDLRAIPFVGAWAQMKQNIPGFYGFGAAVAALKGRRAGAVTRLYKDSLFFRTLVENSMQALAKSNFAVTQYLANDAEFGTFWEMLHTEGNRTIEQLKHISGQGELLAQNALSSQSIEAREHIVLPLIIIQQYALQKLREAELPTETREMYGAMVLRAMFGIINAARNAA